MERKWNFPWEQTGESRRCKKELRGAAPFERGVVNNEIGRYHNVCNGHVGKISYGSYFLSSPATVARLLPPASGFCKIPYPVILPQRSDASL